MNKHAACDVLIVSWGGGGNLPPLLAAGRLLEACDHRVCVLASAATREAALDAGFDVIGYRRAPDPKMHIAFEQQAAQLMATAAGPEISISLTAPRERVSRPHVSRVFGQSTRLRSWSKIERGGAFMPRPDITQYATPESRRKGALAAAERKRELGKTVRERLAEIAQDEAERIADVYLEAMEAVGERGNPDHRSRVRAADALLAQAFGRPPLSSEVGEQSEEIIIISPIMSQLKEGLEAQRELEAARPALPPGDE